MPDRHYSQNRQILSESYHVSSCSLRQLHHSVHIQMRVNLRLQMTKRKKTTSNSFIKIETHFMDIPCDLSMMDYPDVFINKTIEIFFVLIKNSETCPKPLRLVSGGFHRFPDNSSLTDHTVYACSRISVGPKWFWLNFNFLKWCKKWHFSTQFCFWTHEQKVFLAPLIIVLVRNHFWT